MNLTHLGDALDHWKGSVIARMESVLRDLHVVPMFTDIEEGQNPWQERHLRKYCSMLGVSADRVLLPNLAFAHASRDAYFSNSALSGNYDLFLDPDTGVEPQRNPNECHVRLSDIDQLLLDGSDRMVLIYQHSQPYNMRDSVLNRLPTLRNRWPICGLWAGAVSMLFVSRRPERIDEARACLSRWLGPCADGTDDCPQRLL